MRLSLFGKGAGRCERSAQSFPVRWGALIVCLFFGVCIAALVPLSLFCIEAPREERLLYVRTVCPGDGLSLSFIHSVEKCPVRDHIEIDDEYRMVNIATEFWTSRTGLPYAPFGDETWSVEGDHFRIDNMKRVLPEIYLWVDKQYENLLVFHDGQELKLPDLAGDTLLKLSIERVAFFDYVRMRLKFIMDTQVLRDA